MIPALVALATCFGPHQGWARAAARSEIQKVVNAHRHEILRCNDLAPMEDSLCAGWVNVRFRIESGRVTHAGLARNTLTNRAIPACLLRTVKSWRFPGIRGTLEVVYPFHFRCAW